MNSLCKEVLLVNNTAISTGDWLKFVFFLFVLCFHVLFSVFCVVIVLGGGSGFILSRGVFDAIPVGGLDLCEDVYYCTSKAEHNRTRQSKQNTTVATSRRKMHERIWRMVSY